MNGLKENLCEALLILGFDPGRFSFDDKSTIALAFSDVGDVFLQPVDNGLACLWGNLPDVPMNVLSGVACDLVGIVSVPVNYMATGALTLRADKDQMRVGGLLHWECMDEPKLLAAAVEDFYSRLGQLQDLYKIF